jgi:hypothetical protein
MHWALRLAPALAGLAAAALVQAQGGPDELWNMTTRMEMEGMQMPAMSQQVCMKKGETRAEGLGQQDRSCKVTEQRRTGNKLTWKIVCTGENPMTGTGEMTRNRDTLEGRMLMKGRDGEMKVAYSGRLGGTCDAQTHRDPQMAAMERQAAAMQAQGNAQIAQMCSEAMDKYSTQMFEMQNSPCAGRKGEYCARVTKVSQSMRTPAGYRKGMQTEGLRGGGWEQAARYCNLDPAPTQAAACKSAAGSRDWQFVADFCPAETQALATEHCAGRDYTTAMSSEYKLLCQKYASSGGGFAGASRPRAPGQSQQQQDAGGAPAAPSAADVVKDSANKLRGLFGR